MAPPSKNSPNKKSKHALNKFQKPPKQSFKPKSKSDHTVKSQELALQLEDDVPDFPRGGGSSLSKEELDEVHAKVDAEFDEEGFEEEEEEEEGCQSKVIQQWMIWVHFLVLEYLENYPSLQIDSPERIFLRE